MLDQLIPGFWGNPEKQGAAAPLTLICLPLITTFWLNLTERAILRNRVLLQHLCGRGSADSADFYHFTLDDEWWRQKILVEFDYNILTGLLSGVRRSTHIVLTWLIPIFWGNPEKRALVAALASHIWELYLEAVTYLNISWIMFLSLKLWYSRFIWKDSCCMALKLALTYVFWVTVEIAQKPSQSRYDLATNCVSRIWEWLPPRVLVQDK